MVMLPTSKLNSSDSQVSGAGIFLLPLQERVHSCLVQECYVLCKICYILDFVSVYGNLQYLIPLSQQSKKFIKISKLKISGDEWHM
jgi:hypothetical protein